MQELFKFLDKPERVFVMAGSEELPNIELTQRILRILQIILECVQIGGLKVGQILFGLFEVILRFRNGKIGLGQFQRGRRRLQV